MAYFHSKEQVIGTLATTQDLSFEAIWNDDHIDFETQIEVKEYPENRALVGGQLEFQNDKSVLRFNNSNFSALNQQWHLAPDNQISISQGDFEFESVTLYNDQQSITINGIISKDSSKTLLVEFNKFQVNNLNPILKYKIYGELNANIEFQDLYDEPLINSGLTISDFQLGKFLVGDVTGKSFWNYTEKYFDISLSAARQNMQIVDVRGIYTPKANEQLNLLASLNQANLNLVEPFVGQTFSDLQGSINGELTIAGSLKNPKLNGEIDISGGRFKVNYLNTIYNFDGPVEFTDNSFGIENGQLLDENGSFATINGGLIHDGFKDLKLNLSGDLSNFMVLNTDMEKGALYYGSAIVSGDIHFDGPLSNFRVKASAISEKGTKIFIPINDDTDVEDKDYINFISFSDTLQITSSELAQKQIKTRRN